MRFTYMYIDIYALHNPFSSISVDFHAKFLHLTNFLALLHRNPADISMHIGIPYPLYLSQSKYSYILFSNTSMH